jgi:hypothetical protein
LYVSSKPKSTLINYSGKLPLPKQSSTRRKAFNGKLYKLQRQTPLLSNPAGAARPSPTCIAMPPGNNLIPVPLLPTNSEFSLTDPTDISWVTQHFEPNQAPHHEQPQKVWEYYLES